MLDEIPGLKQLSDRPPDLSVSPKFEKWKRGARIAIANTFEPGSNHIGEFRTIRFGIFSTDLVSSPSNQAFREAFVDGLNSAAALLESMMDEIEEYWEDDDKSPSTPEVEAMIPRNANKVFVVHGHDESARETVARFLERLELQPVILHEQPNQGRTIIEKFEDHADVGFAVVLLTPDDMGGPRGGKPQSKPRARQNVILELGFFLGKLGRQGVSSLVKGDVETPSDYDGVVYIDLDDAGSWKMKLVQELKAAGFDIDANRVFET